MTDHDRPDENAVAATAPGASLANPGRRRFAQAGGALIPTILTLAARPTWATGGGGVQCLSARMSGNLSSPTTHSCNPGRPPKHWASNPNGWPAPCTYGKLRSGRRFGSTNPADYSGGTRYKDIFPDCTTSVADTFLRHLFNDAGKPVESNFAAALLSAYADASGYSPDAPWLRRCHQDPSVFRQGASHQDVVVGVILPTFP